MFGVLTSLLSGFFCAIYFISHQRHLSLNIDEFQVFTLWKLFFISTNIGVLSGSFASNEDSHVVLWSFRGSSMQTDGADVYLIIC